MLASVKKTQVAILSRYYKGCVSVSVVGLAGGYYLLPTGQPPLVDLVRNLGQALIMTHYTIGQRIHKNA